MAISATLSMEIRHRTVAMNDSIIVAYDGTAHADDAVALGVLLASCCEAPLTLAHVYRTSLSTLPGAKSSERERNRFLSRRGEELLAQGARLVGDGIDPERRVIGSTTT